MPSEQPNENMDKVLKAYAQKRRDDAAQMELDLPTRNMLQAEVARTLAPVPVPAKARPRFAWWPQIIMGVAGCAAVAIAVILWSPSQSTSKVKVNAAAKTSAPVAVEPAISAAPAAPAATTVASAPAPHTTFAVSAADATNLETPKEQMQTFVWSGNNANSADLKSAHSSLGVHADTGIDGDAGRFSFDGAARHGIDKDESFIVRNGGIASDSLSLAMTNSWGSLVTREPVPVLAKNFDSTAPSQVPAAVPSPSVTAQPGTPALVDRSRAIEKKAVGGEVAANNAGQQIPQANLRFFRVDNRSQYRQNLNSPPLPKVLTNFAVQRNGSNVSVRDADGSLYNGMIILGPEATSLNGAATVGSYGGAVAFQNGNNIPEDTFAFRVNGYNRKLKQNIVFTGNVTNVIMITNGISQNVLQQNVPQNVNESLQQSVQQNLFLNGRVQVGRNTEFEIQAAPTK